jgi:hypothetical protein
MELPKKFDDVSLFFKAHPLRHYTIRLYRLHGRDY